MITITGSGMDQLHDTRVRIHEWIPINENSFFHHTHREV